MRIFFNIKEACRSNCPKKNLNVEIAIRLEICNRRKSENQSLPFRSRGSKLDGSRIARQRYCQNYNRRDVEPRRSKRSHAHTKVGARAHLYVWKSQAHRSVLETSGGGTAHSALRRAVISAPSSRAKSFSPSTGPSVPAGSLPADPPSSFSSLLFSSLLLRLHVDDDPIFYSSPPADEPPENAATHCLTSCYTRVLRHFI